MCHAWVTKDGPSGDECRVTICRVTEWVWPGLPRMVQVVLNVE